MRQAKGLARIGLNTAMAYKADFLLSLIGMPILIIVFYFLWKSIFGFSGEDVINGYTFTEMISYYVLATAVAMFVFSDIDHWIEWDVRLGGYVTELLRPVAYIKTHYFRGMGIKVLTILVEIVPLLLVGIVFFSLVLPSWINFLFFLITVFLASLMFFYITFIVGLSAFWMKQIGGLSKIKREVISFFGGGLIPITFFPIWLQRILDFTPLPFFRFIPINMYLGHYGILESLKLIGICFIWVLALYFIAKSIWKAASKHATGVGV